MKMDLIVNRQLDRQEELAIYELTLKKQRSKKSTVSEKHAAAMQQLAEELVQERRQTDLVGAADQRAPFGQLERLLCRCHSATAVAERMAPAPETVTRGDRLLSAGKRQQRKRGDNLKSITENGEPKAAGMPAARSKSASELLQRHASAASIATDAASCNSSLTSTGSSAGSDHLLRLHHSASSASSLDGQQSQPRLEKRRAKQDKPPTKSTSSVSSASSHSSASSTSASALPLSPAPPSHATLAPNQADETGIKLRKLRLEQLNNELERRLHQYEYLVAQEKAILGAYNLNMFTGQGVNNFHSFDVYQQRKLQPSFSSSSIQLSLGPKKF